MLVDDEPLLRRSVKRVLRGLSPEIREAEDGPSALKMVEEFPPLVLFTDFKMPGMDGRELAEQVHASYPFVRIILHSGNAEYVLSGQWWPDFDVILLPKPAHPDLVRSVVEAALQSN
ncbi:MAG: response regulator [Myxococcota bacterium]|nr:response regulator [Myxococcota bacterium]